MTDFCAAVKAVNQMLVNGMWAGLWRDAEFTEALSQYDQHGFIPVSDLVRLPVLDALVCVTLRQSLLPLSIPHWGLVPQRVVAGTGRRRDTPCSLFCSLLNRQLAAQYLGPPTLKAVDSASLKASKSGLRWLAHRCRVSFETFSAEALREYEYRFLVSPFTRGTVGVSSVSGPVAWLLSQGNLSGEALHEQGVTTTLGATH